MLKKMSVLVFMLAICFEADCSSNTAAEKRDSHQEYTNSLTSGLTNDFAIIESLKSSNAFSPSIKRLYDEKFSVVIHLLMALEPDYGKLTASSTKTLCKLIEYHQESSINVDEIMDANVDQYLVGITPVIREENWKLRRLVGYKDCDIGGELPKETVCVKRDPSRCKDET